MDGRPQFHISLVMDISPNCDCHVENDAPILPDVGMFASFDPVALDLACTEAVLAQKPMAGSVLESVAGRGKDHIQSIFPITNWRSQIAHAKKIGLGEDSYQLVQI